MPRVEQNSMPISLHYALTDSQCSICGGQLQWEADFNNINQPKYISQHCDQDYAIHIDTVKVEILAKASKDKQGREDDKNFMPAKEDDVPKALQMAEAMKRQQQHHQQEEEEG
jgi:hypothetical protein